LEKVTKEVIQHLILKNEIDLSSTHIKLCLAIINRIYRKMSAGINFPGIKVENKLICDGHHRYLASLLANFAIERIQATGTLATIAAEWKSVVFEEEDCEFAGNVKSFHANRQRLAKNAKKTLYSFVSLCCFAYQKLPLRYQLQIQ